MAAVRGYMYGMQGVTGQILCGRQFMNSLDDSSLEECKRAIEEEPWLAAYYELGDKYIKSRDGRIWFSFAGLERNISSVKSKGRILLCWVDEAEDVTDYAWTILIPTLREEGDGWNAELWVTWNPRRKGSATDKRFRNTTDPRYKIVQLNWRDNSKFPAILERQRQRDAIERPDEYDHIWEGAYGNAQGAILSKGINQADRDGRIGPHVEYDPDGAPIEISADIGRRDTATWWFWQPRIGGFAIIDYDGGWGLDAEEWCDRIEAKLQGRRLGKIWLPHDARQKSFAAKRSALEIFMSRFGPQNVDITPQTSIPDRVNAARVLIGRCEFSDKCERGLDGLRAWSYDYNDETKIFSQTPKHDWASHDGDGFSYGCVIMQQTKPPEERRIIVPQGAVTVDQFIDMAERGRGSGSRRI